VGGHLSRPDAAGFETDYRWLTQVYVSVQPTSGTGKLLWHALGAKTIELIHQNVHVDAVRDDLETLVLDAELLEAVMGSPDPKKRAKEFETKLTARLRKHMGNPRYKQLSERLEALKERHERGLLNSVEFLKSCSSSRATSSPPRRRRRPRRTRTAARPR
jgi:type I restriction enzyme R subunit